MFLLSSRSFSRLQFLFSVQFSAIYFHYATRNPKQPRLFFASSFSASSVADTPNFSDGAAAISPDVVAQIVTAVKASLAAEKEKSPEHVSLHASSVYTSHVVVSHPAISHSFGGGPADLQFHSSAFLASGSALPVASASSSPSSGMPSFIVPSFVNTFTAHVFSIPGAASSYCASSPSVSMIFSSATRVVSPSLFPSSELVPSFPVLHQLFIVSPGFAPVPAKTVSEIVSGTFERFIAGQYQTVRVRAATSVRWSHDCHFKSQTLS